MTALAGVLGGGQAGHLLDAVVGQLGHRLPGSVAHIADGEFAVACAGHGMRDGGALQSAGRWLLAVDGRIDDRDGLARALDLGPEDRRALTDGELFLRAWQRWGADFRQRVVGEFALAAWDRQEQRLTLLRDRIGTRPLFYAQTSGGLAFASEPEALLDLPGVSRRCDEDALAYLLTDRFESDDQRRTFYRDVRRLQPGCRLDAEASGSALRIQRDHATQPAPLLRLDDPREYVEAFNEQFDAAVRCRLREEERPALLLSGGIDSASVLASACRLSKAGTIPSLMAVSLVEEGPEKSSETSNILHLHSLTSGVRIPVEDPDRVGEFAELLASTWDDAHPIDNSLLYARLGCLVARGSGCRVMLDGVDGDTLMATTPGYPAHLAVAGHPLRALREARLASRFHTYCRGIAPWRLLARGLAATLQPDWMAAARYRAIDRKHGDAVVGPLIAPAFASRLRLRERILEAALAARERRSRLGREQRLAWNWWNPGIVRALEGTDRTYARFGIEARHPWCDQRVVDFLLRVPDDLMERDGWTKWIARKAGENELGRTVAWYSGKSHLGANLAQRVFSASVPRIRELLAAAPERLAGLVDADAVGRMRAECEAAGWDSGQVDVTAVLQLATLVAWIDRYRLQPT